MHNVVISGASRGIGFETAKAFAASGCNVAICGRDPESLQSAVQQLEDINPSAKVVASACDVSDRKQLAMFAGEIKSIFGTVDVLVNNAGIFIPGGVSTETEGTFEKLISTNLASAYHFTRLILPFMSRNKGSHIFNICSTASITPYINGGSYCISKYGLYGMTKVLREEMKNEGIRVTAVLPGATLTDSWGSTTLPPERFIPASDVAEAIVGCWKMNPSSVVEELLIRPMLGDIN